MNVSEVLAKMDTLDVNEEEIQYIIDENLRVISIPPLGVVLGVEGDKDVNSVKFKMVRYYKGIDLSKFEIRINFANANGDLSYYAVKNPTVTDDTLTFEWLVGYLVTKYKGIVRFVVRMIITDSSTGEVQQAFDTTVGEARSLEGLLVDTLTDEKVYDIVAQLKADLTDHVNNLLETIQEDLADKVPKKDYAPETKTESMTQPVGKDENGKLWTTPGSVFAVSSVNGKTGAVVLTANDVHAMRDDTVIPTVPAWAKEAQKPSYTASEVGADPSGTAAAQVAAHNSGTDTHSDIRLLIQGLNDRLNAMADSDDTTLDQLSEVVAYIKSNRSLIDYITTSKVSVADIVDNLTTNVSNKPLSAAQGVVIKTLIDALSNDKLDASELTNAINTALAKAKESGEFDGQPGADGKSAYQYAQEGGYTGTEAEFAAKLANECIDQTARDYATAANARIDLFTSLEAGSTTGDAELQDIRIGFDGKSYNSAGSAVRGQAEALKNSLDFMSEEEGETTTTTVRNPAVTNLLDSVNLTNNMIVNNSGVETASTNYSLTDYIPITYRHYLTYLRSTSNGYDAIGMVAFYDGNKNFIKRLSEYNGDVYTTGIEYPQIASTNNSGYVRFCIGKNADRPSLIVTDGDTREKSISDYNNYYITITEFKPTGRSVTKLKDGVVTPEKTSFLRKSRNVLDDSNLKFGFIESDGSISDSKFYKYTDKCAVTAGSELRFRAGDTYQGVRKIAFYNNVTLLNVLSYGGYSNYVRSCTVPATATHAVFCIGRAMDKKMVIEGDSYPDEMQEYGIYKLDSQQLPTPADYIRAKGIGINNGIPGGWCKTQASDADLSLASTLNYTDYISEIDAIASDHSDYVAVASPGNDATNTYPVKYYTLVPPGDRNYMRKPIPTVIIIGGIHGGESAGAYAVRTLFLDLCENYLKDERLNYLHNNVMFVIFPVANPYGFGGTYKNGNGVNLNRNFEYGWDDATYESDNKLYGGATAFSEPETQYIKSVIDNNKNVLCVLDIHSNNDAALNSQWKYVNWLSMCTDIQSDELENAALNQIQGLTMRLYEMGKITEEDGVCGYTSHTSGQGMCKSYAASKGIWALTAEGCAQLPSDTASYSKDVQRINAEMVENLVVNILRCASARADDR